MKKIKKANTIIDIIIAVMFISTVLYFCYSLATSAINKRQQVALERDAMIIAENIMNRVLSKGVYTIESEPVISNDILNKINETLNDNSLSSGKKNKIITELGGRLPVSSAEDLKFVQNGNNFSYQVIVDDYTTKSSEDVYTKHTSLKRITVNVYYPTKVVKYLNSSSDITDEEIASGTAYKKDKASLEGEYRVVTLTTYKSAREYK